MIDRAVELDLESSEMSSWLQQDWHKHGIGPSVCLLMIPLNKHVTLRSIVLYVWQREQIAVVDVMYLDKENSSYQHCRCSCMYVDSRNHPKQRSV
jgi:hypothetical protein